ncbi:MAG: phosphoglycerate dehydrogenase [Thermoleophilia bacterium]|jgi:D-3-phosphoglycerate dehydrogenase|nr:phosphoglycerate dehydrogenase [Thermoleophilia bacterium]
MAEITAPRVLVCETIAEGGVDLLRERVGHVDLGIGWSKEELAERIGAYDGIVVRSATKVTAALIERATRLKVVGRAGTGVDNVDVEAATRRGILVCNAPGSNALSAAEHAIALLLAQARNIPQAHMSLVQGRWERSRFGGIEVTGKTLGILGFGRIGQLVAERAKGLGMRVVAYDPFVSDARYRELGVEKAATPEDLYPLADFISLHMGSSAETRGFLDRGAFACMKRGVRIVNDARGDLVDQDALVGALESGQVAGAGIDVFPTEPTTESPLFGLPGVVVTPHLGASTAEAQDRAGVAVAEQVAAALTGGVVTTAVNIPSVSPETIAVLGPFLPLARHLGQLLAGLAGGAADPVEVVCEGGLAEHDTRLLTTGVITGLLQAHLGEDEVNLVNAQSIARERGIEWTETSSPRARDYTNRLTVRSGDISLSGTTVGTTSRPRLVEAFGEGIEIELAPNVGLFRYRDVPGMIGRVGSILGDAGVNIASMAVSRSQEAGLAVMAVTLDSPVPRSAADAIQAIDGFVQVWFVTLAM